MLLDTKYTLTNSTQRSHNILARRLNKLEKLEGSATNIDPSGVIQPQLGMPKEFYENHTFHAQASVIQSGPSAPETDRTGGGTASISTQRVAFLKIRVITHKLIVEQQQIEPRGTVQFSKHTEVMQSSFSF